MVMSRDWVQPLRARVPWNDVGFVAAWEVQSRAATIAMIALVAFVSIWVALGAMIVWSLVATSTYHNALQRGRPDLLKNTWLTSESRGVPLLDWIGAAIRSVLRACLAGVQPFLYCQAFSRILSRPSTCRRTSLGRTAILGVGLTLFGVTTCHHLLRAAGYPDARVLRLSFLGPFLNVPYRVLLSAFVVHALIGHFNPLSG
jgi:hypothetical protein